jgi:alkylhydroperoxidase family enzyme
MARIPYPETDKLDEDTRVLLEKLRGLNIFRMLSWSPHLMRPFVRLGNGFLGKGSLDPVLREIAILRVGYLSKASYETFQHERIGKSVGMSEPLIAAVKEGPSAAGFSPVQAKVMRYVDDLVHNVRASDATFEPLREELGIVQLQELTLVAGYYMMVSRFLETFGVDIEGRS